MLYSLICELHDFYILLSFAAIFLLDKYTLTPRLGISRITANHMNIKLIKEAFHISDKGTAPNLNQDRKSIVRALVRKLATGNVNLQLGRYSSMRDIDERREKVCKYKFVD